MTIAIVIASYIVSVVLSVLAIRFDNKINNRRVYAADIGWSVCPVFNLLYALVSVCYGCSGLGISKWLNRLYGGRE